MLYEADPPTKTQHSIEELLTCGGVIYEKLFEIINTKQRRQELTSAAQPYT